MVSDDPVVLARRLGSLAPMGRKMEEAFEMGRLVEEMRIKHPKVPVAGIRLSTDEAGNPVVTGPKSVALVCPYCGGPIGIEMEVRGTQYAYGSYEVPGTIQCEDWVCDAVFATDGKLVRPSKLVTVSPGGDDEAQASGTEPPSG
jgi:hypothetical protein